MLMHLFMILQSMGDRAGIQTQQKALSNPVDVFKTLKNTATCHHCEHTTQGPKCQVHYGLCHALAMKLWASYLSSLP